MTGEGDVTFDRGLAKSGNIVVSAVLGGFAVVTVIAVPAVIHPN